MNSIINFKNVNFTTLINQNNQLLTVKELLKTINYNIDNLYIDRFWDSIKDDKWIYLDNELILWLEYKDMKIGKEKIIKFLKRNFIEHENYKILNNDEFDINNFCFTGAEKQNYEEEKRGAHNKQYIITSPDCFKELCMHVGTQKSKEIKKYYIELERVFKFYLEYQNEYRKLELEKNKKELEENKKELEEKENIINKQKKEINEFINIQVKTVNKLKKDEFVYLSTNKLNSKNNVFKIGKCISLTGRLSSFNTNSLYDNEFYYTKVIPCANSRVLEQLLHSLLAPFNYKNELFQLHYTPISKLFSEICVHYDLITNLVNEYIENHYIRDLKLDNIIPEPIDHKESNIDDNNNIYSSNDESKIENDDEINKISFDENYYLYKNTKLYICPRNCGFACKERNTMLNHLSRVYKCEKIETDKYFKENLNDSIVEELIKENNIKYHVCSDCNKYFISIAKLNRHRISKESCSTIYQCEKCEREFRNVGEYNVHIRNVYCLDENGNRINYNNSEENNTDTSEQNNSTEDYTIINLNGTKLYKCNLCGKTCNVFCNIKSHLNKKNKCNAVHKCNKCSREFHTLENYNKHLKQKIDCSNQLFECSKCKKQFTTNRNLLKHMKNVECTPSETECSNNN